MIGLDTVMFERVRASLRGSPFHFDRDGLVDGCPAERPDLYIARAGDLGQLSSGGTPVIATVPPVSCAPRSWEDARITFANPGFRKSSSFARWRFSLGSAACSSFRGGRCSLRDRTCAHQRASCPLRMASPGSSGSFCVRGGNRSRVRQLRAISGGARHVRPAGQSTCMSPASGRKSGAWRQPRAGSLHASGRGGT